MLPQNGPQIPGLPAMTTAGGYGMQPVPSSAAMLSMNPGNLQTIHGGFAQGPVAGHFPLEAQSGYYFETDLQDRCLRNGPNGAQLASIDGCTRAGADTSPPFWTAPGAFEHAPNIYEYVQRPPTFDPINNF